MRNSNSNSTNIKRIEQITMPKMRNMKIYGFPSLVVYKTEECMHL